MKRFILAFTLLACTAFLQGCAHCLKCNRLTEKDMAPILTSIKMEQAKVLAIGTSPIKGLWEVALENKGQRIVLYVDSSKRYITGGPLIDFAHKKDVTRERIEELNKDRKIETRDLPLEYALLVGRADAPHKVIVFTDPG